MKINGYLVNANLVKADIGTMSLVYLPERQVFLVLNKTAGMLLTILEQGRSKNSLINALSTLYPSVEERVIERTAEVFLHLVVDNGIAVLVERGKAPSEKIKLPAPAGELEMPIISAYEKKWIIQNHPDAVYDIAFSDTWSPAAGGV
ncbi:hypothetical protein [Paraburkholderia sp. MM6662-R1]|uniref:hypothetical protein n=1 Tax=Paraburkholderia sp. MM6662-R1 TaxID=2991066 RepID=UPI003D25A5FB